jgi:hypothetical protein
METFLPTTPTEGYWVEEIPYNTLLYPVQWIYEIFTNLVLRALSHQSGHLDRLPTGSV